MQVLIFLALFVLACLILGAFSRANPQPQGRSIMPIPGNQGTEPQPLQVLTGHPSAVRCLMFSDDGVLLVSGSTEGMIQIWHLETGHLVRRWSGHTSAVTQLTLSPDQQILVSGSQDGVIKLWRWQELSQFPTDQ